MNIEKAKSDRSKCKKCKDYIKKNSIRGSLTKYMGDWDEYSHYHFRCFITLKQVQNLENIDECHGFDKLSESQQKALASQFLNAKKRMNEQKKIENEEENEENIKEIIDQDKNELNLQKELDKGRMEECEDQGEGKDSNKMEIINQGKVDMEEELPSINKEKEIDQGISDGIERVYHTEYLGYTIEEANQFEKILEEVKSISQKQQKEELKNRGMLQSGTANEVSRRLADCRLLGVIPLCPQCKNGRMSYKVKLGIYKCPGYHTGQYYLKCDEEFKRDQIRRKPWN